MTNLTPDDLKFIALMRNARKDWHRVDYWHVEKLVAIIDRLTEAPPAPAADAPAAEDDGERLNLGNANDLRKIVTGEDFSHDGDYPPCKHQYVEMWNGKHGIDGQSIPYLECQVCGNHKFYDDAIDDALDFAAYMKLRTDYLSAGLKRLTTPNLPNVAPPRPAAPRVPAAQRYVTRLECEVCHGTGKCISCDGTGYVPDRLGKPGDTVKCGCLYGHCEACNGEGFTLTVQTPASAGKLSAAQRRALEILSKVKTAHIGNQNKLERPTFRTGDEWWGTVSATALKGLIAKGLARKHNITRAEITPQGRAALTGAEAAKS